MNAVSRAAAVAAVLLLAGAAVRAADVPPPPTIPATADTVAPPATPAAATPVAAAKPVSAASATAATPGVRIDLPASDQPREPVVQRTVIDDGRAVIEELRVRGQLVKATVHPKDGAPSYEIIVGDGSRELSTEGRNNSRGATGKRVWQVLSF